MATLDAAIDVVPIAGSLGAEVRGVDLSQPISAELFDLIRQAFIDHLVIFLPGQRALSPANIKAFAELFGRLDEDPFVFPFKIPPVEGHPEIFSNIKEAENTGVNVGGFWHADVTYREKPHKASVLYAKDVPPFGGDTMFANMHLAYETLAPELKDKLLKMEAVHSSAMPHGQTAARFASIDRENLPASHERNYEDTGLDVIDVEVKETVHPVVREHPVTGKQLLYVNRGFTSHFVGMTVDESLPLLEELWAHSGRAEFTCRYRWSINDVAVWDNCATHHYAINDYYGRRRHMQRVSIHED